MITININTANDAFQEDPWGEVASILESIATNMRNDQQLNHFSIYDTNGNKCGFIKEISE